MTRLASILYYLDAYKELWIPVVLYIALNVARRDWLVKSENPFVRGVSVALERVLVLEWDRWGGKFKKIGPVSPKAEGKDESETG